jgi:Cu+-exporting ATPase
VRWAPETTPNETAAIAAIEKEGFEAHLLGEGTESKPTGWWSGWSLNLGVGIPVTLFLMLGEWGFRLGTVAWFRWSSFALAAVVQVLAGARFYRGAWIQLKAGQSNMDTLVALGSTTAFGYSVWALMSGQSGHVYFMEAAAIITLISAGHWMESRVSARASSALRQLLNLAPTLALRLDLNGTEKPVPVSEVKEGDRIVLRPGDRVATDGVVLEGASAIDESMLTGESVPVDKKPGSEIFSGTINVNGRLVARVTATGEETALAHIVAAVQRAQSSRATIQRLGDRVSSVFVPLVAGIALASGLWWGLAPVSSAQVHLWLTRFLWHAHPPGTGFEAAFIIAASVLIIACPCAMGLATPAAIMAGSNAAAQRGILIRDGIALEKAGAVSAVVFDKTGTLTYGKPIVAEFLVLEDPGRANSAHNSSESASGPGSESRIRQLASTLARPSNHPLSRAVAALAPASGESIQLADWKEIHGGGVQASQKVISTDRPIETQLGSLAWLGENGVDLSSSRPFVDRWSSQGATIIGLTWDRILIGMIALQDTLKPGAAQVVQLLQQTGLKTFLITGDSRLTGANIALQVGIPAGNVFAEVRPEQKADLVKKLQDQGEHIAFVGDGINDAPALEQADLGIAVSRASDIAREAADLILLKSEIEAIPESLGLARATLRTIRQNLFWAFFYNALGIPLAALGFMSPILCAAAMGLSDLVVIGNALRLRRWHL